jgi:glycerophosphoryl diester phosphodiesterase
MLRVGHRGAPALAPPNTIEGVRAALAVGVDMIEFDVSPGMVVAHDPGRPGPPLEAFLDELNDLLPAQVGVMVDLKTTGYERATVRAVERAGLLERAVFATLELPSVHLLAGEVRTSFSFNRRRPGRAAPLLRRVAVRAWQRSGATDATIRHTLLSPALVQVVHSRGGRVFAWTVNSAAGVRRAQSFGVDGIITDDPRLLNE